MDAVNDTLLPRFIRNWFACDSNEYVKFLKHIYKCTAETKLRNFQYRLLIGKIYTNDTLFLWKIVQDSKCDFCNESPQTVKHLLWECLHSKKLLDYLEERLGIVLTLECYVSNYYKKSNTIEKILLLIKYYLYRCKCSKVKPVVEGLNHEIRKLYNIEKLDARIKNKMDKFTKKMGNMGRYLACIVP